MKQVFFRKGVYFMKIAVTYENGNIFQHFGHSEAFKVYTVENDTVVSSEVISSEGQGHGALAALMAENTIDVVICGGIGGGAINALSENGIEVCSGVSGDADEAVEEYLKGNLFSEGVNCDHHGEGHSCGDHEDGGCHCGSHDESEGGCHCGGGCHGGMTIADIGPNAGKTVKAHYRGTFNDGTQFDSSYDRGEPIEFVCGAGMMIKGFDVAVANMAVGEKVNIHLMPEEAYGMPDPQAIFTLDIVDLPGSEDLTVGEQVYLTNQMGQPFPVTVYAKNDLTITFDANHEMAGKELNFEIELVEIQ